jgi:hypothetical protein
MVNAQRKTPWLSASVGFFTPQGLFWEQNARLINFNYEIKEEGQIARLGSDLTMTEIQIRSIQHSFSDTLVSSKKKPSTRRNYANRIEGYF